MKRIQIGMVTIFLLGGISQRSVAQCAARDICRHIQWTPDSLTLSDAQSRIGLTLTNAPDAAREVWLSPECTEQAADTTQTEDKLYLAAWHNTYPCVAPWLAGYPQHLVLAPGERRTLPIRVFPPRTLPDGDYTARLIINYGMFTVTSKGDTLNDVGYGGAHMILPVTYAKGPYPPRHAQSKWQGALRQRRVAPGLQVTPAVLVLDDRRRSTRVTLHNLQATSAEVWLMLDCPWFHVTFDSALVNRTSQYEQGWDNRIPTAVFWLNGYPQHLVLAPHEQRVVTVRISPYMRLPAGSYYARFVYVQSPVSAVTASAETTFVVPMGSMNVVYHRGTVLLRPVLTQLQVQRHQDGTRRGCVTIHQPGLGLVAVLHAEVEDAQDRRRRWSLDTTVTVLEVAHHTPLDDNVDGTPVSPSPVCVVLPAFASGRYRLRVSAYALEDIAHKYPVQAAVPLEIS